MMVFSKIRLTDVFLLAVSISVSNRLTVFLSRKRDPNLTLAGSVDRGS